MSSPSTRRVDDRLEAAPVFEVDGAVVRLLGSDCPNCGAVAFPQRVVCVRCGGPQTPHRLTGSGTVHSWTTLANPPHGFDRPIGYGCVDLDEGPRVLGLVGDGGLRIGTSVQAVPARARHEAQGFRFEVVDA
jgi:uncharacterized OB-fold protein